LAENNKEASVKDPFEKFCEFYILYFDEARGHMPLLIYPSEKLMNDRRFMRPIKFHPIWFLDVSESDALDHIDLEYKGYNFMAKKFLARSQREKKRAGLKDETPETIILILSMPNDLAIFGDELIQQLYNAIRENFDEKFSELIKGIIAKEEIIKTPAIMEKIKKSDTIKNELRKTIGQVGNNFFSRVIKQADASTIKKQKAISYLYLRGVDFSHINMENNTEPFSSIQLFDRKKKRTEELKIEKPFSITNIEIDEGSKELVILVRNNTTEEKKNITVKITHIKDFFEKELMTQEIDEWYPEEELLFISPIIPHINEYLFFILSSKGERILSKKIDLELLKNEPQFNKKM